MTHENLAECESRARTPVSLQYTKMIVLIIITLPEYALDATHSIIPVVRISIRRRIARDCACTTARTHGAAVIHGNARRRRHA